MFWIQFIIFLLLTGGLFSLFAVNLRDFTVLLPQQKKNSLQNDVHKLLGKPNQGFLKKELSEIEQLLKNTGREGRFITLRRTSLLLFALGAVIALFLNNVFMIPVLGAAFAFIPIWYLRSTSAAYKKHLSEELETAVSTVTTSYLRSGDLIKAVRENVPYMNPPVKFHFESFLMESEMLNANLVSAIHTLKGKIPNTIFHEWCDVLIQCQSDRNMKHTLSFTVQKFSDIRIIQSELDAIINAPKREAITMILLVIGNIPLLYMLNRDWFTTLVYTLPGKLTLAVCAGIILFSITRIMKISRPMEYTI